ncbi:uncharacterized protein [Coffea arabica]|uniref:DNA helicase Pif1-like 2B domain-containing protein n=1 Tax=Coffea arabica TaxID=13443 RepID=A0A6P6VIP2_COFAR|nr:uncharacterized protein LOC113724217 [Coffea arabica]
MGKSFADYHLTADIPSPVHCDKLTKEIECERSIEVLAEDLIMSSRLNIEQRHAYDLILQSVFFPLGQRFFVDGPGGTGEGREPVDRHGEITFSSEMVIPYTEKEESLNRLLESVFPDLIAYLKDPYSMINRCVLAPKNTSVDEINDMLIRRFPRNLHVYVSSDRTVDPRHQGDYEDFLNSQNPKSLPPHKLLLKENCPIMLMRNLNPTEGLCNGTRLICRELRQNTICAEIAFGHHQGKRIFLPKIPMQVSDNDKNGLPFIRAQFPFRVCFALTINKSQGQTLDYVGINLREPVFSHEQLYVTLSRVKTSTALKVLILLELLMA